MTEEVAASTKETTKATSDEERHRMADGPRCDEAHSRSQEGREGDVGRRERGGCACVCVLQQ